MSDVSLTTRRFLARRSETATRVARLTCAAALLASALLLAVAARAADEVDPCTKFTWDVSHELAVFKQPPKAVTAGAKAGASVPKIDTDGVYELSLQPQSAMTYAIKPGKPTLDDNAQAGLVQFHADEAGRYRVSITSGHWIDLIAGGQLVKSRDFQGARGCPKPHKIVEYELPAAGDITLQLSGSPDAKVLLAVTHVNVATAGK